MITLKQNESLKIKLNSAHTTNALSVKINGRLLTDTTINPISEVYFTDNTNEVVITPAVAANEYLDVHTISIYNADTTLKTVEVILFSVTNSSLYSSVLGTQETITYNNGWKAYNASGVKKVTTQATFPSTGLSGSTTVVVPTDVINNNSVANTLIDTGLSVVLKPNVSYYFKSICVYDAQATTTGSRWVVNCPGTLSNLILRSEYSLTTTTVTTNNNVVAINFPSSCNSTSAYLTNNIATLEGHIRHSTTTPQNFTILFASEVSNSAITCKTGSFLLVQEIG